MRWDEDIDGTGSHDRDRVIDFRAPLEVTQSTVLITLNDDLGRRFRRQR